VFKIFIFQDSEKNEDKRNKNIFYLLEARQGLTLYFHWKWKIRIT